MFMFRNETDPLEPKFQKLGEKKALAELTTKSNRRDCLVAVNFCGHKRQDSRFFKIQIHRKGEPQQTQDKIERKAMHEK